MRVRGRRSSGHSGQAVSAFVCLCIVGVFFVLFFLRAMTFDVSAMSTLPTNCGNLRFINLAVKNVYAVTVASVVLDTHLQTKHTAKNKVDLTSVLRAIFGREK